MIALSTSGTIWSTQNLDKTDKVNNSKFAYLKDYEFQQASSLEQINIAAVTASRNIIIVITAEGTGLSWGDDTLSKTGILGQGLIFFQDFPSPISDLHQVNLKFVTAGKRHAVAISEQNRVYVWGSGYFGRSGQQKQVENCPVLLSSVNAVLAVCGNNCTVFIDTEGRLAVLGSLKSKLTSYDKSAKLNSIRRVNASTFQQNNNLEFKQVSIGDNFAVACTQEGHMYYLDSEMRMTIISNTFQIESFSLNQNNLCAVQTDNSQIHVWEIQADQVNNPLYDAPDKNYKTEFKNIQFVNNASINQFIVMLYQEPQQTTTIHQHEQIMKLNNKHSFLANSYLVPTDRSQQLKLSNYVMDKFKTDGQHLANLNFNNIQNHKKNTHQKLSFAQQQQNLREEIQRINQSQNQYNQYQYNNSLRKSFNKFEAHSLIDEFFSVQNKENHLDQKKSFAEDNVKDQEVDLQRMSPKESNSINDMRDKQCSNRERSVSTQQLRESAQERLKAIQQKIRNNSSSMKMQKLDSLLNQNVQERGRFSKIKLSQKINKHQNKTESLDDIINFSHKLPVKKCHLPIAMNDLGWLQQDCFNKNSETEKLLTAENIRNKHNQKQIQQKTESDTLQLSLLNNSHMMPMISHSSSSSSKSNSQQQYPHHRSQSPENNNNNSIEVVDLTNGLLSKQVEIAQNNLVSLIKKPYLLTKQQKLEIVQHKNSNTILNVKSYLVNKTENQTCSNENKKSIRAQSSPSDQTLKRIEREVIQGQEQSQGALKNDLNKYTLAKTNDQLNLKEIDKSGKNQKLEEFSQLFNEMFSKENVAYNVDREARQELIKRRISSIKSNYQKITQIKPKNNQNSNTAGAQTGHQNFNKRLMLNDLNPSPQQQQAQILNQPDDDLQYSSDFHQSIPNNVALKGSISIGSTFNSHQNTQNYDFAAQALHYLEKQQNEEAAQISRQSPLKRAIDQLEKIKENKFSNDKEQLSGRIEEPSVQSYRYGDSSMQKHFASSGKDANQYSKPTNIDSTHKILQPLFQPLQPSAHHRRQSSSSKIKEQIMRSKSNDKNTSDFELSHTFTHSTVYSTCTQKIWKTTSDFIVLHRTLTRMILTRKAEAFRILLKNQKIMNAYKIYNFFNSLKHNYMIHGIKQIKRHARYEKSAKQYLSERKKQHIRQWVSLFLQFMNQLRARKLQMAFARLKDCGQFIAKSAKNLYRVLSILQKNKLKSSCQVFINILKDNNTNVRKRQFTKLAIKYLIGIINNVIFKRLKKQAFTNMIPEKKQNQLGQHHSKQINMLQGQDLLNYVDQLLIRSDKIVKNEFNHSYNQTNDPTLTPNEKIKQREHYGTKSAKNLNMPLQIDQKADLKNKQDPQIKLQTKDQQVKLKLFLQQNVQKQRPPIKKNFQAPTRSQSNINYNKSQSQYANGNKQQSRVQYYEPKERKWSPHPLPNKNIRESQLRVNKSLNSNNKHSIQPELNFSMHSRRSEDQVPIAQIYLIRK